MAVDGNFRWGGQGPGNASLNRWQLTRGRHEVRENHTHSIWRRMSSCTASSHAEKQEGRIHCGTQGDRVEEGEAGRGLFVEGLVGGGREVQVWPKIDRKTLWALFERSHFGCCMKYYLWKGRSTKMPLRVVNITIALLYFLTVISFVPFGCLIMWHGM